MSRVNAHLWRYTLDRRKSGRTAMVLLTAKRGEALAELERIYGKGRVFDLKLVRRSHART